ncbi:MAG: sigma-70 family RNA polymerase sigma factor [Gemmatimonadaceae bacterium]|nr:sigma-70 family RNA polymerase sigma factor [Gemmatimonadaceae bacterium]
MRRYGGPLPVACHNGVAVLVPIGEAGVKYPEPIPRRDASSAARDRLREESVRSSRTEPLRFHDIFAELFNGHFEHLYRYLDRLSGDPDLAADLAQEAFIRLYRRGSLPDSPQAWLISVAMNLLRNVGSSQGRRSRLLTLDRAKGVHSPPGPSAEEETIAEESRARVRAAADRIPERDKRLLMLASEGYSYRDMALALELNEASVGTLLARARRAFRAAYGEN